jgi:hypothetical protein
MNNDEIKNIQQYTVLHIASSSTASRIMILRIMFSSNSSIHKYAVSQRQEVYWNASGFHAPLSFSAN